MVIEKMSGKTRKIIKRKSTGKKCSYFDPILEVDIQNIAYNVQVDHFKLDNGTTESKICSTLNHGSFMESS